MPNENPEVGSSNNPPKKPEGSNRNPLPPPDLGLNRELPHMADRPLIPGLAEGGLAGVVKVKELDVEKPDVSPRPYHADLPASVAARLVEREQRRGLDPTDPLGHLPDSTPYRGSGAEARRFDWTAADDDDDGGTPGPGPAAAETAVLVAERRLELPGPIEQMSSPELEEVGVTLVEEILMMRKTLTYDERYEGENGVRLTRLYDTVQAIVDELCEKRGYPKDSWGPHKNLPKATVTRTGGDEDEEQHYLLKPPEFGPEPQAEADMWAAVQEFKNNYGRQPIEAPRVQVRERFPEEALPDVNDQERSIRARSQQYETTGDRTLFAEAQADLQIYFRQAKNHGLLDEVDDALNELYAQLTTGNYTLDQKRALLNQGIDRARVIGVAAVREIVFDDDSVPPQLLGVWDPYIEWARRRMERRINNRTSLDHREGEWSYTSPEETGQKRKETYWKLGAYQNMYIIEAQTEEEFLIAKQTFFAMIRTGTLGRAPTAVFESVRSFIAEFSRTGGQMVEEGKVSPQFMIDCRKELEGLLYLRVSSYSKEVYNQKQSKDAAEAMSVDEPTRWVSAFLAGEGGVAASSRDFDYDLVMEIFNNPFGERGELDTIAGHFLQDSIQRIMVEKGMGRVLKYYDPRDRYLSSDDLGAKIQAAAYLDEIKKRQKEIQRGIDSGKVELPDGVRDEKLREGVITVEDGRIVLQAGVTAFMLLANREQAMLGAYEKNRQKLALTQTEEGFKCLYERFDEGDYHIRNFMAYHQDQQRGERERLYPDWDKLPQSIKDSINLGRVQTILAGIRGAVARGEMRLREGMKPIDLLDPADRAVYEAAFDEASSNFEIAFDMQGVLGEKARRGKGYLLVDRNLHIQKYYEVSDQLRAKWSDPAKLPFVLDYPGTKGKIIVHNPETEKNEEKTVKTINLDLCTEAQIEKLTVDLIQAGLLEGEAAESFKKGWLLNRIRRGKETDGTGAKSLTGSWKALYDNMSAEEKKIIVESIPTWEMENWIQWGITQIKHQYRDRPAAERRRAVNEGRIRLTKEIKTYGYSAQLIAEDRVPGQEPVLLTYKRPLGTVDLETGEFKKYQLGETLGYSETGREVKLAFDADGKLELPGGVAVDRQGIIVYDSADPNTRQRKIHQGLTNNTRAELVGEVLVEEAVPTFRLAAGGADFRCWTTMDTYYYYQGNNKDTILRPHIFAGAERILAGLSRPEDEDPLCLRLLTVDPTLRRVREFPKDQQGTERKLVAAALAESFNDKMRIRHGLYRAFLPEDGYAPRMRAGFRNEDWAGMDRLTFGFVEQAAEEPLRFVRRMKAKLAMLAFEHDSAAGRWGVHGVSGAINLVADTIKDVSHQGIKGQFGLMKVFAEFDLAIELFNAIKGYTDSNRGEHVFGLGEKPVDDFDALHKYYKDLHEKNLLHLPEKALPFLQDLLTHFGRLKTAIRKIRLMHTNNENSDEALYIPNQEVFLPDGSYNEAIESETGNGYGRQRQRAFLYGEDEEEGFYAFLRNQNPGGGSNIYGSETPWFWILKEGYHIYSGIELGTIEKGEVQDYVTDKHS